MLKTPNDNLLLNLSIKKNNNLAIRHLFALNEYTEQQINEALMDACKLRLVKNV